MVNELQLILATGTSGTIGKHLISKVTNLELDLATEFELKETIPTSNWNLIHLAGLVGPDAVRKQFDYSYKVNVKGSIRLAEQAIKNNVSNFIYVSTSHVYAPTIEKITEHSKVAPVNIYAEQKFEAENGLLKLFGNTKSNLVIIRVFSILDWGMPSFTLGGAIERLIFEKMGPLKYTNDVRDFLTPKKVAEALCEIGAKNRIQSGIYNLSSGVGTSIADAALRMGKIAGIEINRSNIEEMNSPSPMVVGANDKIKSLIPATELIWRPSEIKDKNANLHY